MNSMQIWLKGGDNNTSYFHKQTKSGLSFNIIKELNDSNGQKFEGHEAIKRHIFQHFRNINTESEERDLISQAKLLSIIPPIIPYSENEELVKPISEHEISESIWTLHLDKAPGLDGFTINFYRVA